MDLEYRAMHDLGNPRRRRRGRARVLRRLAVCFTRGDGVSSARAGTMRRMLLPRFCNGSLMRSRTDRLGTRRGRPKSDTAFAEVWRALGSLWRWNLR
jgi:hypothetical protein